MREKEEQEKIFTTLITKNVLRQGEFLGIPKRNIAEAVLAVVAFITFLFVVPFSSIVRNVSILVYGIPIFIFFLHGIKNRSVSEIIIGEVRYLRKRRALHLRGPEYVRQPGKSASGNETKRSDFQGISEMVKEKVKGFIDEYSD